MQFNNKNKLLRKNSNNILSVNMYSVYSNDFTYNFILKS